MRDAPVYGVGFMTAAGVSFFRPLQPFWLGLQKLMTIDDAARTGPVQEAEARTPSRQDLG